MIARGGRTVDLGRSSRAEVRTMRRVLAGGRRTAVGLTLGVAAAVVAALVLNVGSSSRRAAGNARTASGATAVQRRDLVETDTESGTLSYAGVRTVYDGLSGTITWLPSAGQVIRPGHTLFKVNGQPVVVMNGATPAYRDLTPFDSAGQDILELNRDLVELGFNPDEITVNDTWQAATTAGVDAFQASLGEIQTGSLLLGNVVFLPGEQLVSTVEGTLGAPAGSGPAATSGGGSASPILQTTSTRPVVTVDLDPSKQSEATLGERVTVEMPSGSTVNGTVTAVSPVASSSSSNNGNTNGNNNSSSNSSSGSNSSSSGSTIPVTVTLAGRHSGAGLDHALVSVKFAQAKANSVLSVPVTALLATAGGGYAVQEVAARHRLIPVSTGLFAAGYVQISGAGINPGLRVTDSQG
jgi:hypothetical protein